MVDRAPHRRTGGSSRLSATILCVLWAAVPLARSARAVAEYPSNGHIAYEHKEGTGTRDIWYMKADGTGKKGLATDGTWPTWRPDGTKISYSKNDETWVMNPDGSGNAKLTGLTPIQWWGTGQHLCKNTSGDVYKVDYPGGTQHLVCGSSEFTMMDGARFVPRALTWDGRWLLVSATDRYRDGYTGSNGYFNANNSAVMLDMNDKSKVYFIGDGCEATAPPTGNYIYHVYGGGWPNVGPYRMNKGDTSRASYTEEIDNADSDWGHEYFPRISTDNVWMTYGATTGCHDHDTCAYQIFIHRLGGGRSNRKQLTNDGKNNRWPHMFVGTLPGTNTVRIDSFTVDDGSITQGDSTTLRWTTTNATTVSINQGVGTVSVDGSKVVSPAQTTTYTLTAEGTGGPVTRSAEVIVVQAVGVPFRMNCGVNSYTPSGWAEDDAYVSGGNDFDAWNGTISTAGVANAAPDTVYETVRHMGPHTYTIPISNGSYVVRMHFCEGLSATSTRDVKYVIEGTTVEDHMDYATAAGAHFKAVAKDYDVNVADGDIVIECTGYSPSDVFEAGIEILAGGGPSNQPPTVSITNPADGASFAPPADVAVTADASDTDGTVSKVDLYLDGTFVRTENFAPYEWTLTALAEGSYTLTAEATDDDGATATSAAVTVTVTATAQPTITLVQPDGGEVWYVGTTASIKWTVAAVDDVAISYWSGASGSWQEIAPTVRVSDAEWGSYPWTVPDAPSTDCHVSISDYNMVAAAAQSAAPFEIRGVTDSDSDGMDDSWEMQHFGDLTHDETTDTDGDGLTDAQEFDRGTDPNDPNDPTDAPGEPSRVGFVCGASGGIAGLVFLAAALALLGGPSLRREVRREVRRGV